jgi:predicted histidine transporter YuiF (NhaC family)
MEKTKKGKDSPNYNPRALKLIITGGTLIGGSLSLLVFYLIGRYAVSLIAENHYLQGGLTIISLIGFVLVVMGGAILNKK